MSVLCGSTAILGHVFTPYLRFKGGKGVATALGVVTALATWPAIYAVGAWGVLVAITRYVSLGSMVAMVTIPVTYLLRYGEQTFRGRIGVSAVPTEFLRPVWTRHAPLLPRSLPLLSLTKGVEQHTLLRPSQILAEVTGDRPIAVMSGPNIAWEVAKGWPATTVAAGSDKALV